MEIEKNAQKTVTIIWRLQTIIFTNTFPQKETPIFHQNKIFKKRPKASKSRHIFFPGFILKPSIAIQKNGVKKENSRKKSPPPPLCQNKNIIKYHSKTPKFLTDKCK